MEVTPHAFGCSAICFSNPCVALQQGRVECEQHRQGCGVLCCYEVKGWCGQGIMCALG